MADNIYDVIKVNPEEFHKTLDSIAKYSNGKSSGDVMDYIHDRLGKNESFDKIISYLGSVGFTTVMIKSGLMEEPETTNFRSDTGGVAEEGV